MEIINIDTISRKQAIEAVDDYIDKFDAIDVNFLDGLKTAKKLMTQLPPIQPDIVRCRDCKHFEYDHVESVNGIPLIVAHEICMRWSDGVKTSENGYCFLAEKREVTE